MKKLVVLAMLIVSQIAVAKRPIDIILEASKPVEYVCQLCPHVTDIYHTETYEHDGKCPICGMHLIEKHERVLPITMKLHKGSGNYFTAGSQSRPNALINVFYHMPRNFNANSPILIVVPGAGRNAWNYRDSWVETSEKYGVLILSPSYAASEYDFAAYHLGGTVTDLQFTNVEGLTAEDMKKGKKLKKYRLKDEDLIFNINSDSTTWLYEDFDRIFEQAVRVTGSTQTSYDLFGHSAGGQILHRLAIFKPVSKVNRIIAANSGSYTLPTNENNLPFGLKDSNLTSKHLAKAFAGHLAVFVGEKDNAQESRGTMLHTPIVDQQGLGRLSRGKYFYNASHEKAKSIGAEFNWTLNIVENVGHDYELMGKAAATYLYGK